MRIFVLKILSLFVCIVTIIVLIDTTASPYWGNEIVLDKIKYLKSKNTNEFDTYFIGSSRVNHQIDARLFDRLSKNNSFNLGCPALSGIEKLKIANTIVDEYQHFSPMAKNIFIEMPLLNVGKGKNIKTTRGSYYINFDNIIESMKNDKESGVKLKSRIENFSFHFKIALKNFLKLESFSTLTNSFIRNLPDAKKQRFRKAKGYVPLVVGQQNASGLKRRNDFLKDTSLLVTRLNEAKTFVAKRKNIDPINDYLFNEIESLIEKGKKNNIKIYIILFPKSNGVIYKKTMNVFTTLDDSHTINLAKPGKYRDFYLSKFSYDKAHLNKEGSTKLTQHLVEEYQLIR